MQNGSNWVLDHIIELDIVRPGLAGQFLRASVERRQVVAAHLAFSPVLRPDVQARLIASATHDDILAAAMPTVPTGYRAILGRSGAQTRPSRFYRYLSALLLSRETRLIRATLYSLSELDLNRLRVLRTLPEQLRTPHLVILHRDLSHAKLTTALFRLMVAAGADEGSLIQSLRTARTSADLMRCWKRAIEQLSFPAPPLPASNQYRPILTGGELKAAALRYRNCLRRFLTTALDGRDSFALFSMGETEVVVHLRQRHGTWHLDGVHGPRNRPVSDSCAAIARAYLASNGITPFLPAERAADKWEPLREVLCRWEFERDEDIGWA